jgi:hypothetical protein
MGCFVLQDLMSACSTECNMLIVQSLSLIVLIQNFDDSLGGTSALLDPFACTITSQHL